MQRPHWSQGFKSIMILWVRYVSRVAGNAAYILGTVAESELGCVRVIGLTDSKHPDSRRILPDLTGMLLFDDAESVMNAAGTMGTLVNALSHCFLSLGALSLIQYSMESCQLMILLKESWFVDTGPGVRACDQVDRAFDSRSEGLGFDPQCWNV